MGFFQVSFTYITGQTLVIKILKVLFAQVSYDLKDSTENILKFTKFMAVFTGFLLLIIYKNRLFCNFVNLSGFQ